MITEGALLFLAIAAFLIVARTTQCLLQFLR